ncbi:MAG: M28 family metallopeptidase [Isosphaeraceae bacterium]
MSRRVIGLAALALLTTSTATRGQESSPTLLGFATASRTAQIKAEEIALRVPTPEKARALLRTLTEDPHAAGTPADYQTALFVRDQLKSWGWNVEIAEYEVMLNYPKPTSRPGAPTTPYLRLVLPEFKELSVTEAPNPFDKDSADPGAFPAFHGYGVSGTATGQVVYANYGRPEDFAALDKLGISVQDRIVLVRYGELFRGLKIRNAQKRGASGVLIYSDPIDDGYAKGDVYPKGPFRPGSAIQRGSVQFLSLGPGDPSTPAGPSVKGARRLPIDSVNGFTISPQGFDRNTLLADGKTQTEKVLSIEDWEKATGLKREDYFATIPSLPISYDAARPILEALGGPIAPTGWQGGLPLTYHVGPGPASVQFAIDMEYKVTPIWNVIATIKGTVEPDRWILIGNHRDAWVYGAVDPSSGTAATLEACRAIGEAVKAGWKPRRTLVYASWDAEEYGLVGSTEWTEERRGDLDAKAALLLNVDSAVAGHELDLDGVPSLRDLLLDAMGSVQDPRSGKSLREGWIEKRRAAWAANAPVILDNPAEESTFAPQLNPLGSGSDYTAFLDNLGIPAVDVGFTGRYGVYHSIFDNVYWMETFCDPEYLTHTTAARLYTLIAMRAAGADVLPLTFQPYAQALRDHLDDLRRIVTRRNRASAPGSNSPLELVGLSLIQRAIQRFQAEAEAADLATRELAGRETIEPARLESVNAALQRVERAFLLPEGLPGRPWFKHAIFAPGLTTGYASWPLPGVRQAVLEADAKLMEAQSPLLASRIEAAADALRAVTEAAKAPVP